MSTPHDSDPPPAHTRTDTYALAFAGIGTTAFLAGVLGVVPVLPALVLLVVAKGVALWLARGTY